MKKILHAIVIIFSLLSTAKAQSLPSFQMGLKGGLNLASISSSASATFSSSNQAGYIGGFWARFGALGFNLQPELYFTSKNVTITKGNSDVKAKFTSIDVPLLFGAKVGALGIGGRFYTGPVISFAINKSQSFGGALDSITGLDYKDQNFAWQFGAGLDIKSLSFDLRYEAGITKQAFGTETTRINLFNLTVAYRLLKF